MQQTIQTPPTLIPSVK